MITTKRTRGSFLSGLTDPIPDPSASVQSLRLSSKAKPDLRRISRQAPVCCMSMGSGMRKRGRPAEGLRRVPGGRPGALRRHHTIARMIRAGHNVLSVHADAHFSDDPYIYLKRAPLNKATLVTMSHGGWTGLTTGFLYVQNAAVAGPCPGSSQRPSTGWVDVRTLNPILCTAAVRLHCAAACLLVCAWYPRGLDWLYELMAALRWCMHIMTLAGAAIL